MSISLRFLDIDLDAFLNHVVFDKSSNRRANKKRLRPWPETRLRQFLEDRCLLSRDRPIGGRFFEQHDEAFYYWRTLVLKTKCTLDVTHIDAHADLGLGGNSWVHVVQTLLHLPPEQRTDPPKGPQYLHHGSYLAYALAARWVSSLIYVYHPHGGYDLPPFYFRDNNPQSGHLELKAFSPATVDEAVMSFDGNSLNSARAISAEPLIPFAAASIENYQAAAPFDFGLLCQSPGYTPTTADALIAVIGEYIRFDGL
jgi:hypothetical protein